MKYCELLYPFLIECCKYTEDRFWKSIFEDLAYGITPSGTYINKDFLMCNYKDKEFTYKIQNKNSKEIYDELFNIFKSKLCLVSRDEIINKKKIIEDKYSNHLYEYVYWSDIKKKNIIMSLCCYESKSQHKPTSHDKYSKEEEATSCV
jgi:hypothetical protein